MVGLIVNSINAFIVTKLSTCAIARFITDSKENKSVGFGTGFIGSTAIACGVVSITTLALATVIPITLNAYDHDEKTKGFTRVSRIILGFAMGGNNNNKINLFIKKIENKSNKK